MRKSLYTLSLALSLIAVRQSVAADTCAAVINGQGSTLLAPFVQASATAYNATNPGYTVTYNTNPNATGSGNGISQLQSGATFFGGTDIPPTCTQQTFVPGNRILTFPVAIAGVAIGYNNTDFPQGSLELTADDLAGIFTGTITDWAALGGTSQQITVFVRSGSSGDTGNFTQYLANGVTNGMIPPADWTFGNPTTFPPSIVSGCPCTGGCCFMTVASNSAMASAINSTPGSIGYLSYGFTQPGSTGNNLGITIPQAGVENSLGQFIFPSVTNIGQAAQGACIPLDLNLSTVNLPASETTSGTYPIASPTNLIAMEYQPSECDACEVANWLFYMGTTAQTSAASFFLAPLTQALQAQFINNLNFIQEVGDNTFTAGNCGAQNNDSDECGRGVVVKVINNIRNVAVNANSDENENDAAASASAKAHAHAHAKNEKIKDNKFVKVEKSGRKN